MREKTKHPITCSGSSSVDYDEFHFSEADLILTARQHVANIYGIAINKVLPAAGTRSDQPLILRIERN